MKRPFGKFGFREISYDRPNQQWVCGRECEGQACPFGPDLKGDCQATHECIPVRKNERWICNRTRQGSEVAPCEAGPTPEGGCCRPITPCTPVRSLRAKRGILVLSTMALSLGIILLLLSHPAGSRYMSPGELTHAHSSASSQCLDCHEIGAGMPIDWMHAFTGKNAAPDSQRCLKCHALGEEPMNPHSLPLEVLAESRARVLANAADSKHNRPTGLQVAALGFAPDNLNQSQLACSACHVEHQGKNHDLKTLSNARCQVCHSVQFQNFEQEHPPFGDYPFKRRTRIVFDHANHLKNHFPPHQAAPKNCRHCHELDERGETMRVKSYEQSCAACHQGDFSGLAADAPKIDFVNVPALDAEVMADEEIAIGQWPLNWDESFHLELLPVTGFLLQQSSNHSHAVHQILAKKLELDFLEEPEDLQHGFHLAWGVKQLLYELTEEGLPALFKRIEAALKRPLTAQEKKGLEEVISPEFFVETVQLWFPNIYDDVEAHLDDDSPEAELYEPDEDKLSRKPVSIGGNWFRSDTEFTLSYRPAHHADPFMKIWLELASAGASATNSAEYASTNSVARLADGLFGSAAASQAGRCMKCHTTEPNQPGRINWHGYRPDQQSHGFNRFSHESHFSLLDERGCVTCHQLQLVSQQKSYLDSFRYHLREGDELSGFIGNFKSIDHATCASCHSDNLAGGDCLTCHNYHIGNFESTRLKGRTFQHLQEENSKLQTSNSK